MDIITEDELEEVDAIIVEETANDIQVMETDYQNILKKMDEPIPLQQELAVQIKNIIDQRVRLETRDEKPISETTRRWMIDYNNILNNIQKNKYGDKSVSLNIHTVGHSAIASKIRKFNKK